jgi:hypothetical protein
MNAMYARVICVMQQKEIQPVPEKNQYYNARSAGCLCISGHLAVVNESLTERIVEAK